MSPHAMCCVPGCSNKVFHGGFCAVHDRLWDTSPERARSLTAQMDFARRVAAEQANRQDVPHAPHANGVDPGAVSGSK